MQGDTIHVIELSAEEDAIIQRRRRTRRTLLILVGSLFILLLLAILGGAYASVSADCADCHTDEATGVAAGPHAATSCAECHISGELVSRTRFGAVVLFGMQLHLTDPAQSVATEVPRYRCTACHDDLDGVVGNTLKIDHAQCAPQQSCISCHSQIAHRSESSTLAMDMFDCLNCHNSLSQTAECDTCHDGRVPKDRLKSGSFAVTHGINWIDTHGMGSMPACSACHAQADCGKCHGAGVPHTATFFYDHGSSALSEVAGCTGCHLETFCTECHAVEMPHPAGFKERHSAEVESAGKKACLTCHLQSDCDTCHTMHIHPGGSVGKRDGR